MARRAKIRAQTAPGVGQALDWALEREIDTLPDGAVRVFELSSGLLTRQLEGGPCTVTQPLRVAYSPDGRVLLLSLQA